MTAIRGLGLALWQRNRLGFLAVCVFLLFFEAVLAGLGEARMPTYALVLGTMFAVFSYLMLIGMFIHPDADVGTGRSSYPAHMFTLPVRTTHLVFMPMLLATLAVFGAAFSLAGAARLGGVAVPLFWPAALAATILALLQAIFWYPLGIPYSKLVLTLTAIPTVCIGLGLAIDAKTPEAAICAGLAVVTALSYAIAYIGVVRARWGDSWQFGIDRGQRVVAGAVRRKPPFRSPGHAQRWYEWRQHGIVLPATAAIVTLLFYIPLVWDNTVTPLPGLGPDADGMVPTIPTYVYFYYPVVLILIPFAAWVIGCGAKRSDVKRGDRTFQLFYDTRPMADAKLAGEKLKETAISVLIAWAVVLVLSIPILFLKGGHMSMQSVIIPEGRERLYGLLMPYIDSRTLFCIAAILLFLMLLTWRNHAIGFWIELSGKSWLRYAYPVLSFVAYGAIPSLDALVAPSDRHGPWLTFSMIAIGLWMAVTLKLGLAAWLAIAQCRSGLVKPPTLMRSASLYFACCGAIIAIVLSMTGTLRRSMVEAEVASPLVASGLFVALVVLWMPIARLLAMPMALASNRHRG